VDQQAGNAGWEERGGNLGDHAQHGGLIGDTHFEHLLPVYVLAVATVVALSLSRSYLTAPVSSKIALDAAA
jgi:hypothetical protein